MNGATNYSLDKSIFEIVLKEMFIEDQEKIYGNIAIRAFKSVKDDAGDVVSYTVNVKNKSKFNHMREIVSAGL